ncbi:hypothetical protein EXIGLDRAFT_735170 [Exidia glandulosa HHB12029]|uniref:DUF6699 domain-containing protein n=1 Tax=Exidia glandulosa HHB12029 TaxID=1314781 RepID=A0A165ATB1_EXIGL|nr:hypothetical protein EXIGLDRAFT_735170 [Exidia glandulosa HHB12029]
MYHHYSPQKRRDAPYTPRFQPQYQYPVALPHPPGSGQSYWPGRYPPTVQTPRRATKAVRFLVPKSSKAYLATRSTTQRSSTIPLPPPSRHIPISSPTVAPLLALNQSGPPKLHFDVQYASTAARLRHDSRPLTPSHRDLRAFLGSGSSTLRIKCDLHPWSFDISTEATVGEFIDMLSRCLWRRVRPEEWSSLDSRNRAKLQAAFSARVARAGRNGAQVHRDGLLRLDWLQGYSTFLGLYLTADPRTLKVVFGPLV